MLMNGSMNESETVSVLQRSHRGAAVIYQKPKPVAMITASRPASSAGNASFCDFVQDLKAKTGLGPSDLMSSASTCSLHSNTSFASEADASHYSSSRHNYSSVSYDTSSIYATLKRNKRPPPPPPKRTNSVKSASPNNVTRVHPENGSAGRLESHDSLNSRDSFFDAMQEQAFATCVKSLASKFSQMASVEDEVPEYAPFNGNKSAAPIKAVWGGTSDTFPPPPPPLHSALMQRQDVSLSGSAEFPPPPTPLCQSAEDLSGCNAFPTTTTANQVHSPERSLSSSSNESLPFANDNVGTIRQSGSHYQHCNPYPTPRHPDLQTIDDMAASLLSFPPSSASPVVLRR